MCPIHLNGPKYQMEYQALLAKVKVQLNSTVDVPSEAEYDVLDALKLKSDEYDRHLLQFEVGRL